MTEILNFPTTNLKGLSQIIPGARNASKNGYFGHFQTEPSRPPYYDSNVTWTMSIRRKGAGVSKRLLPMLPYGRKKNVEGPIGYQPGSARCIWQIFDASNDGNRMEPYRSSLGRLRNWTRPVEERCTVVSTGTRKQGGCTQSTPVRFVVEPFTISIFQFLAGITGRRKICKHTHTE